MAKEKVSRFAPQLEELGFRPFTAEEAAYLEHRTERRVQQLRGRNLTRNERRIAQTVFKEPRFILFETSVGLNDELGNGWRAERKQDTKEKLEALGFKDATPEALLTQALMPPLPPEKNH